MIERPQDVGAAVDLEAGPQREILLERLYDGALVVVELPLDTLPERVKLVVRRSCAAQDLEQCSGAFLDDARVARVQAQQTLWIGLVDDLAERLVCT